MYNIRLSVATREAIAHQAGGQTLCRIDPYTPLHTLTLPVYCLTCITFWNWNHYSLVDGYGFSAGPLAWLNQLLNVSAPYHLSVTASGITSIVRSTVCSWEQQNKKNKIHFTNPLWGEYISHWWIALLEGSCYGKRIHAMISSWYSDFILGKK